MDFEITIRQNWKLNLFQSRIITHTVRYVSRHLSFQFISYGTINTSKLIITKIDTRLSLASCSPLSHKRVMNTNPKTVQLNFKNHRIINRK